MARRRMAPEGHRQGGRRLSLAVVLVLALASACTSGGDAAPSGDTEPTSTTSPYEGYRSEVYGDEAAWLCRPDLPDDPCHRNLDTTAVMADGTVTVVPFEAAEDPAVDCFYVYPTTSFDPGPNSDLVPGEGEEINTAYNQAARFRSACRVFAPLYRQATLSTIGGGAASDGVDPRQVAYDDVLDAFRQYVAHDSKGRGFVLLGHSQGASILRRIIAEEIDAEPRLRDRLVSALLLGATVAVPEGEVVGGDFAHVPLCQAEGDTGCVVSYASFRADAPPPEASFFARTREPGMVAACVTPAGLSSGSVALDPYFLVRAGGLLGGGSQPFADPDRTGEISTPWVTFPGLVDAECVREGPFSYLALTVHGDPTDPRTDDIGGDLSPEWGMHLVDVNVAMGDLVDLVAQQADAYAP